MDFKTLIIKKIISHFNHTFTISSPNQAALKHIHVKIFSGIFLNGL